MSVMKDYAKKEYNHRKAVKEEFNIMVEGVAFMSLIAMGAALGLMLGYGLLYTGVGA